MSETTAQFELPPGYVAWCHICKDKNTEGIPGLGFKTMEDWKEHAKQYHDYRKF